MPARVAEVGEGREDLLDDALDVELEVVALLELRAVVDELVGDRVDLAGCSVGRPASWNASRTPVPNPPISRCSSSVRMRGVAATMRFEQLHVERLGEAGVGDAARDAALLELLGRLRAPTETIEP